MRHKNIQIKENPLKQYINEVLNEMKRSEFELAEDSLPTIPHSTNAFLPSDIIARDVLYYVTDENGNKMRGPNGQVIRKHRDSFNTIVAVENGVLKLDNGTETSVNNTNIKCTDTWYTIWKSMQSNPDQNEKISGLYMEYQEIDGEIWIVVTEKCVGGVNKKDRYSYTKVKNARLGEKLMGVRMDASPQLNKSGFWITPNTDKIIKAINQMEGMDSVPKEFVLIHDLAGQKITNSSQRFAAFDINEKENILSKFPWFSETTALWGQPQYDKNGTPRVVNGMKIVNRQTVKRCLANAY